MISILIPTYNTNVSELIKALALQMQDFEDNYELICYEDGSTNYLEINAVATQSIGNAKHIISTENKGRISTRQLLASSASYDWLLFLDADVIPKDNNLLKSYLNYLNSNYDAIYGGYAYALEPPESEFSLRYNYGTSYEQVEAATRNKTPYKIAISGNFLIRKSVFLNINSRIESDGYGYDNYFAALMKSQNVRVWHIDNNVYHNGLDANDVFLDKVESAVETLLEIHKNNETSITENTLLELYKKIDRLGLSRATGWLFRMSKTRIKKRLLSANPNLKLLQFYKLGYLCALTSRKK